MRCTNGAVRRTVTAAANRLWRCRKRFSRLSFGCLSATHSAADSACHFACSALRLRMADALVVVAAGERPAERKLAWHALALVAKQVLSHGTASHDSAAQADRRHTRCSHTPQCYSITHRMTNPRLSRCGNQWSGVAHLKRLAVDVTAADAAANNAIAVISALQACSCPALPIHSL